MRILWATLKIYFSFSSIPKKQITDPSICFKYGSCLEISILMCDWRMIVWLETSLILLVCGGRPTKVVLGFHFANLTAMLQNSWQKWLRNGLVLSFCSLFGKTKSYICLMTYFLIYLLISYVLLCMSYMFVLMFVWEFTEISVGSCVKHCYIRQKAGFSLCAIIVHIQYHQRLLY